MGDCCHVGKIGDLDSDLFVWAVENGMPVDSQVVHFLYFIWADEQLDELGEELSVFEFQGLKLKKGGGWRLHLLDKLNDSRSVRVGLGMFELVGPFELLVRWRAAFECAAREVHPV